MVYKILEQRCHEWGVPLYISTIDFTKAFDRIKHSALWSSLCHRCDEKDKDVPTSSDKDAPVGYTDERETEGRSGESRTCMERFELQE